MILQILAAANTWDNLITLILTVASVITALTVIAVFIRKSNNTVNDRIRTVAKEVAAEETEIERELRKQDTKRLEENIQTRLDGLEKKLDTLIDHNLKQSKKQDKVNLLLQQGHIETWKNDIRTIYYNLRDTGNISDVEKSYVDKIYHLYEEMGGNSDIKAKYEEMTSVYKKRLEEQYDAAFEKEKSKKKKNTE